jgi:hypothetical protein
VNHLDLVKHDHFGHEVGDRLLTIEVEMNVVHDMGYGHLRVEAVKDVPEQSLVAKRLVD